MYRESSPHKYPIKENLPGVHQITMVRQEPSPVKELDDEEYLHRTLQRFNRSVIARLRVWSIEEVARDEEESRHCPTCERRKVAPRHVKGRMTGDDKERHQALQHVE